MDSFRRGRHALSVGLGQFQFQLANIASNPLFRSINVWSGASASGLGI